MSDENTTNSAPTPSTESVAGNHPVSTPPPAPATHSDSAPQWATDLGNAISALPETIARSVKEAIGKPQPAHTSAPAKQEEKTTEESSQTKTTKTTEEPGKPSGNTAHERFANWWFKR